MSTYPLLFRTDSGKRRCQSTAPVHGNQCEKKRKHTKKDDRVVHQAGSLVWGPEVPPAVFGVGETVTQRTSRLLRESAKNAGVDLSPWQLRFATQFIGLPEGLRLGNLGNTATFVAQDEAVTYKRDAPPKLCGCGRALPHPPIGGAVQPCPGGADETMHSMCDTPCGPECPTISPDQPTDESPENQLRDWWFKVAHDEVERTVPKAVEYGSTDLLDIGTMLARTLRRDVSEEEAAELGVFFYLIGKVARWQSAIERGSRPSDDTLFDIGVYVRMVQRIRHSGGWPGTDDAPCNHIGGHLPSCKERDPE